MTKLPITLCLFTSTKGHFGHKDVYLTTLSHLARQIPLCDFAARVAHIKVSEGDSVLGDEMEYELKLRGFTVVRTTKNWSRGMEHQNQYVADIITLSKVPQVYDAPFILWLEDDSVMQPNKMSLETTLARMTTQLEIDPDIVSWRFLRRCDWATSQGIQEVRDQTFFSEHFNFQPLIMRARDFYLANKVIDDSAGGFAHLQIEMFWRMVLGTFSRAKHKHVVWLPDYAETVHLGTPDYPALKASLNL